MERSPGINVIQKMIFIFNALESGWIVRKVEGDKYEFKKHKDDVSHEVYLESYVKEFIRNNLSLRNFNNSNRNNVNS